jgi:hypothetical protein
VAAGVGGERVGEPPEAQLRATWVLEWGRQALSGGDHRCRRIAAADPAAPARWRLPGVRGRVSEPLQVQEEVDDALVGYVAGRTLGPAAAASNGAGGAARVVERQALYWRPVAVQGEVEEARTRDEKPVALIGGLRPYCGDEHEGLDTDVAGRGHDPPGRLGARDIRTSGLGARGGLGKVRVDPEAEGSGRFKARRARARPALWLARRRGAASFPARVF